MLCTMSSAQLRVYRFDPGSVFEGGLVGALERMQITGDSKLLDALFIARDADGTLQAVDWVTGGASASFASLLDFRLDPGRRDAVTERTLAGHAGGVDPAVLEATARTLEAGAAVLAVLHTGPAPEVLDDAVTRCGGRAVADEAIDVQRLGEAGARVQAAAAAAAPGEG